MFSDIESFSTAGSLILVWYLLPFLCFMEKIGLLVTKLEYLCLKPTYPILGGIEKLTVGFRTMRMTAWSLFYFAW